MNSAGVITYPNDSTNQNRTTQTILVQVDMDGHAPEPGTWATVVSGAVFLILLRMLRRV